MTILLFGTWKLLIGLLTILFIQVSSPSILAGYGKNETHLTFRANFPTAWATGISPLCYNDSQSFLKAFLNREKWALQMYRATGVFSLEGLNNFEVFSTSPGLFDECLSIKTPSFQGKYCSAFFQTEILSHNNDKSSITFQRDGDKNTFKLPRIGFCIPSSCRPSEFRSSVNQLVNSKNLLANDFNYTSSLAIITISDENYCYTRKKVESSPKLDGPVIVVLLVLCLLGFLLLFGTLYDTWRYFNSNSIDSNWKRFLICFSALENGRKLLSTKTTPADISCLHGIRFLSATWIILYHIYFFIIFRQRHNTFGPEKYIFKDWSSQAFLRGAAAVDTFIVMSGLLVSYSLLKELQRNSGRLNLFSFYLHRCIRITSFYFFQIGFMSTLVVFLGTGPLWHFIHQYSESCRNTWWTHFLFVKNHFMMDECTGQGWYLAADMQLFVVSPLFIYPLWKWKKAGLVWAIFLIMAVIGIIGTLFTIWSLPIVNTFFERPMEWTTNVYDNYYFESWTRVPQYIAGVILGWLILKSKNQVNMNWVVVIFGWIFAMATILVDVYGFFPFLDEDLVPKINPIFRISYGTLSQFGWALAVCWIVFACINGYGGFVNTLLSWKGFMPLGKLTFTAYLIHQDFIQVYDIGLSRMPLYYNKWNLAANYIVVMVASFVMAFVASIAIEMPFINLDRAFLTRPIRNKNENNLDGKMVSERPTMNHQEQNSITTDHTKIIAMTPDSSCSNILTKI